MVLICIFLIIIDIKHFSYAQWVFVDLLLRNVYSGVLLILKSGFFLPLSCLSFLCVVDIDFSSDVLFADTVYHSAGCRSTLLLVSFVVKNLPSLM